MLIIHYEVQRLLLFFSHKISSLIIFSGYLHYKLIFMPLFDGNPHFSQDGKLPDFNNRTYSDVSVKYQYKKPPLKH